MNFFIIMGTLCILLAVNVETKLSKCTLYTKGASHKDVIFAYGYVCTRSSCDWAADSKCKSGTSSKVLKWETDIFEVGFPKLIDRPKEIVIKIDLNKDYYIEINVISDNKKRTVNTILKECSHKGNSCEENLNFNLDDINIGKDHMVVGIGFRKDKKMNFVAVSKGYNRATASFGPENVYEFKMKGFYFNRDETMKITVSSKFDKNFKVDGFRMVFPTSAGGFAFNAKGYLIHGEDYGCRFYGSKNEKVGLPYIIKEYYNNSENWKATPVRHTVEWGLPYFGENGMKVKQEEMHVKEEKNPKFDATKMERKGCKYVDRETDKVLPGEEPDISLDLFPLDAAQTFSSKITIADEVLIKKTDIMESDINITEFIERVGGKEALHQDYLSNLRKGGDDYSIKLLNGTVIDLQYYKFATPPKKEEKKTTTTTTTKKTEGGSGGAGDASRGQKQIKIIPTKHIVILILMILSV